MDIKNSTAMQLSYEQKSYYQNTTTEKYTLNC